MREKLGICQWFHYQAYSDVERTRDLLKELGVTHLRTGISWADFHRPEGRQWYQWQMQALADFELLVSVWHTPPSISEGGSCASPPRRLEDYAEFLHILVAEYGDYFNTFELWNEPNNRLKWDFEHYDPQWEKFGHMIKLGAEKAKQLGKETVLGGIIPVDPAWLQLMESYNALQNIDVLAIHGFPNMWWKNAPNWEWYRDWHGWQEKIDKVSPIANHRPVWVTETGLATWDLDQQITSRFGLQSDMLQDAASAPTPKVYWYTLVDLNPELDAIEGFHVDENEYHLGLVRYDGTKKPAFETMQRLLANG